MPSHRRCRGHAQPFPASLPELPAPSSLVQPWIIPQLSGQNPSEGAGGKGEAAAWAEERLHPPAAKSEPVSAASSRLPASAAASCNTRAAKNGMNNGTGLLRELRVSGTRSHTEQGDPCACRGSGCSGSGSGNARGVNHRELPGRTWMDKHGGRG